MTDQPLDRLGFDGIVAERVVYYAALYPRLREVARQHGYALALHGSLAKDLDVIAVPWTATAVDGDTLARALMDAAGGLISGGTGRADKLHGRVAWTIMFADGGGYIDLSVIPRAPIDTPPCPACGVGPTGPCPHVGGPR